jgi:pimeloyl-ACP methyl ester carboxylesterase
MVLRKRVFQTPELALNYAEGPSNGSAFVVLHAGSARWQYGLTLLEALAESWHGYAPDFCGHGLSGHVPGAYSMRDYVRDTAAPPAGVAHAPAVVYGRSLGGEVGVMLAAVHPELVRALIVSDASLSLHEHATERPRIVRGMSYGTRWQASPQTKSSQRSGKCPYRFRAKTRFARPRR